MAGRHVPFALTYLKLNLASAMEYRVAFFTQIAAMALNDALMLVFWWMYFERFPQVGGWQLGDLFLLWGLVATSFGLAVTLFGGFARMAALIAQGQLDYYLTLPKDVLLHVLVSRMSLSGWGDIAFGLLALGVAAWWGLVSIPLALLLVLLSAAVLLGFEVLIGSLGFYMGSGEAAGTQAHMAMIHFTTYPGSIFKGWVRVLLFTALPAGFVAYLPVELLKSFDPLGLAALVAFCAGLWVLAVVVFRRGLRRYESGNLMVLRG